MAKEEIGFEQLLGAAEPVYQGFISDMQNNLPKRKTTRLREYDYSQNGAYFVTICIKDKKNLLGSISDVGANCVRPILSEI